jgi:hypothetical protein
VAATLLALTTGVLFAFQFGVSQEIAASFVMLTVLATCWIWVWIPMEAGRGFRFDVGHRSDLKPATIPI